MKSIVSVFIKQVLPFFPAILVFSFSAATGQTPSKGEGEAEKYKLVFRTMYDGKLGGYLAQEETERQLASRSSANNFISEINAAARQNYRLVSALPGRRIAILALDETPYEYDWFESESPVNFAKSGLNEKLIQMLGGGFRMIDHSLLSRVCELTSYEFSGNQESCIYRDFFLFEKNRSEKHAPEQILIDAMPGWGVKPSADLEKRIVEKCAEGFYPVRALSAFQILAEKIKYNEELSSRKTDFRVIRSSWGGDDLSEKVNDSAKQGYRLATANYGIAIMYRNDETRGDPVSYVWLKADRKSFDKELAKLQETGAIYRLLYPGADGVQNALIFETGSKKEGARAEFKVIKFELEYTENRTRKKVFATLSPKSKQNIKILNSLAREGFQARDLFDADGIKAILERRR